MTIKASGASPLSQSRVEAKHHYRFKYLKSDHWSNLRIAKLASVDANCINCGKRDLSNDVHHLRYKKLYDVQLEDLVVLCRGCHDEAHEALDLCREYIKGSKNVWETTIRILKWKRVLKEKGFSESLLADLKTGKDAGVMWKYIKAIENEKTVTVESIRQREAELEAQKRNASDPEKIKLKQCNQEISDIYHQMFREKTPVVAHILFDVDGDVLYPYPVD